MTNYLSTSTVAERLNVSHDTVNRYIDSGELAAIDVSNRGKKTRRPRLRVAEDELARFLRERQLGVETKAG